MKFREYVRQGAVGGIGFTFLPYQIAVGVSLRVWHDPRSLAFRFYLGPAKVWGYVKLGRSLQTEQK